MQVSLVINDIMGNRGANKAEKKIIQDLKEVREGIENDSSKKFDPNEVKSQIDDLPEQVKGSDADSDASTGADSSETKKQVQDEGSDAGKT